MSVIQQIRDKAAWLVFGLIALSLIGFLAMDAFVGKSRIFGGNSNIIGTVNGEDIEYPKFQQLVEQIEAQYKAQGYPTSDMQSQNIRNQVWNQFVEDDLLEKIYKKTGIDVSDKELNDMLAGPDAVQGIKRSFTDPKTGIFDAQAAASTINQLRTVYKGNKKTDKSYPQAKLLFEEYIPQWVKDREKEKYLSLLGNSAYVPKWMAEKMNSDQSQIAAISYVNIPYSTIADSTVKVSDEEINDYMQKHKEQYKQKESRSIAYVTFNAAPTATDSNSLFKQLTDVKREFDTTHNTEAFIAKNGSDFGFSDSYENKSKIEATNKDSISSLPKNSVFGPYFFSGDYVLAKKMDEKSVPDSIKCRHILIKVADKEKGQIREDSTAKKLIDSIEAAVKNGADFNQLVLRYSEDDGSKNNKGEYSFASSTSLVKPFYETVFYQPVGTKKVVKAESNDYIGYHYIEVLSQKNFQPGYKIAYLAKKIEPSNETDQNASGLASQFAGESRSQSAFDENTKKGNLQKLLAPDVEPSASTIPGLGTNRQLVKWVFDDKTSVGDVSEPYTVGDKYVVAVLTEINHEGTMKAAKARPMVEPILRNQKKSEQIIAKISAANSLDAVAKATGQQIQKADSIGFASPYIPNVGQEAKVIGASFDKQLAGKPASQPIAGNGGVFVIKVENVSAKSNAGADVEQLRKNQQQQEKSILSYQALEALKKNATIKDNRAKFF